LAVSTHHLRGGRCAPLNGMADMTSSVGILWGYLSSPSAQSQSWNR
jgi:hypothetical protein